MGNRTSTSGGREALDLEVYTRELRKQISADLDLERLNRLLEGLSSADILQWAWRTFQPEIVVSSSFQTQSLPLLHMIADLTPEMPIVFLDTGFHFQETLAFRDRVQAELRLRVNVVTARGGHGRFQDSYGELYRSDPDMCCYLNKVEPMERALRWARAWISGIRRDQAANREDTPIISRWRHGLYKISPLASWTREQIEEYRCHHGLPEHPLEALGYRSVGCSPCTRPVRVHEQDRDGRWSGSTKTECGLHQNPDRVDP